MYVYFILIILIFNYNIKFNKTQHGQLGIPHRNTQKI